MRAISDATTRCSPNTSRRGRYRAPRSRRGPCSSARSRWTRSPTSQFVDQGGERTMLRLLGRNSSGNVQKVIFLLEELALPYRREDYGRQFNNTDDAAY